VSRKIERPAVARHIHIFEEDWDFLEQYFGRRSANPIGPSKAIRNIVHKHIGAIRAKQLAAIDEMSPAMEADAAEIARRLKGAGL
jgi:hypothetical protein